MFTLVAIVMVSAHPQFGQQNNPFFPNQGFPQQGSFNQQGFPQQGGFNQQGFPNQQFPNQGFQGQNFQNQGFPGQNFQNNQFRPNPNNPFLQSGGSNLNQGNQQGNQGFFNGANGNNGNTGTLDEFTQQNGQSNQPFIQVPPTSATPGATVTTPSALPAQSPAFLACMRNCQTTNEYNPVCGTDQVAYPNQRRLDCANRCGQQTDPNWQGT